MKEKLVFPELHFVENFKEENEELIRLHGDAAICSTPTTVDIIPGEKILTIHSNGHRHHYHYDIPVNFDMEKYKRIYESLKEAGIWLSGLQSSRGSLIPDKFRVIEPNFDAMSREELLAFIKAGKSYRPDTSIYFNTSLLNVDYVRTPRFIGPTRKMYECQSYKTPTLAPIFRTPNGKFDYDELLKINLEVVDYTLKQSKYNCIYTIDMEETYITDELTVHTFYVRGVNVEPQSSL